MFTINLNLNDLQNRLGLVESRLKAVIPSIEIQVKQILRGVLLKVFEAEGIPRWKKLSPYTIRERRREGYPAGPILVRSGKLKRSYTGNSRYGRWTVTQNSIVYQNILSYAPLHEHGDPESNVPARHVIRGILEKKEVRRALRNAITREIMGRR